MSLSALHKFIDLLEAQNELVRVSAEADPLLEIAAVTDRVCKQPEGCRALLFEHPSDSKFPVATNLFGSIRRVCLALGIGSLDVLTERMSALLAHISEPAFETLDRQIAALSEFSRFAPILTNQPCHDHVVMNPPDLTQFPFLQTWPEDGSAEGYPRYITLPLVFTTDPAGNNANCGMYRCQVRGKDQLAIRWKAGSGAAAHLEEYRRMGKRMPVAIALGGDTAVTFSAMFPLPGNLDEMTFAGFLRGAPMETAACRTVPLQVPASAEVVIEGYVDPAETVMEGPFGNHTGFYSPAGEAALMRVTAITHRSDAIIPATVVGPPPMEDCWMAKAWEAVLSVFLRRLVPDVSEICLPLEWMFHQSAVISLVNPDPVMVRETAKTLWSMQWFSAARLLIFVDAEVDVADLRKVAWSSINLSEFSRDLIHDATGSRLALDATGSGFMAQRVRPDSDVVQRVAQRWQEYGIF